MAEDYIEYESLECDNPKYHKNCVWVKARGIRYPASRYLLLKSVLEKEVAKSGTAHRITHWKFGILVTIKKGHDGSLFVQEDKDALREFAGL